MGILIKALGTGLLMVLLGVSTSVFAASADEIENLLKLGKFRYAYDYAQLRSAQEAGDPRFDFFFGLAALEAGHPEQAVFALERVLFVEPKNDRARLELGRAQHLLGNYTAAREAFETVLTHNPPATVRNNIERYMQAVAKGEASTRTHYQVYSEVKLGYDSNINSATGDANVTVPLFGGLVFSLDESSRSTRDSYAQIDLGAEAERPLSKRTVIFGALKGDIRDNFSTDTYDSMSVDARVGAGFVGQHDSVRIPVQVQQLNLDGESYRQLATFGLEWSHAFNAANRSVLYGQIGSMQYPEQETRDVSLGLLGGAWVHRLGSGRSQFTFAGGYGVEQAGEDEPFIFREHNGREYYEVRMLGEWMPHAAHAVFSSVSFQSAKHSAAHPVFAEIRRDKVSSLTLGWNWQLDRKWTLKSELSYYDIYSNIDFFSYDRVQVQVGARYAFF